MVTCVKRSRGRGSPAGDLQWAMARLPQCVSMSVNAGNKQQAELAWLGVDAHRWFREELVQIGYRGNY